MGSPKTTSSKGVFYVYCWEILYEVFELLLNDYSVESVVGSVVMKFILNGTSGCPYMVSEIYLSSINTFSQVSDPLYLIEVKKLDASVITKAPKAL